jgi:hypothetical protein
MSAVSLLFASISSDVSVAAELIAAAGIVALAAALGAAVYRVVAQDGYGHRPAPRGTDEWSANGLPSRPYGV